MVELNGINCEIHQNEVSVARQKISALPEIAEVVICVMSSLQFIKNRVNKCEAHDAQYSH